MVWNPSLCIQLYTQEPDQQLYPQEKGQSVKIIDSKANTLVHNLQMVNSWLLSWSKYYCCYDK